MSLSVGELAELVGGRVRSGNPSVEIRGAAAIAEAGEGHITFLGNPKYAPQLRNCAASAALLPNDYEGDFAGAQILVENPSLSFAAVLKRFAPEPIVFQPGIHPTAVVAPEARLGEGVSIQPCAVVEPGAEIGDGTVVGAHAYVGHEAKIGRDCHLHPSVTIRERCLLGDRVIIHSGTVVGSDGFGFEFSAGRHVKIPQTGIVQIDDDVEVGANCTIDRARFGRTWIGEGTKIDNLVQIAHNVVTGKHCIIVSQVGISGSSRLGNYVTLAGQVGMVGHIEVGDRAIVAAQSGISKSIPAGGVFWGTPALPINDQKESIAVVRRLPKLVEKVKNLERKLAEIEKSASSDS